MTKRRDFLKTLGLGSALAVAPGVTWAVASSKKKPSGELPFGLGIASYSLRKFTTEQALDMALRLDIHRMTFKSMHLPLDADQATIKKVMDMAQTKGVDVYGGGVIYMKTKKEVDQAFEYARLAGMKMIVGVPEHALLDYVEEKVKQTDIRLAIHNHGPGDKRYPSAESAYVLLKNRDPRMGLCIDIGHTKRIGRDPEQDVKDFFDRVFDIHIKDVTRADENGKTCIIGRGVIDFPSFLKSILKLNYRGTLALEYEAEGDDPLPGMAESIGYVKGILKVL